MPEYQSTDLIITVKFNAQLDSEKAVNDNAPKYPYTAEVRYDSVKDAVEKAGKFTVWALARRARKGELPRDGRTITVNGEGEYHKSVEDSITDMSPEEFNKLFALMQARMAAMTAAITEGTPVPVTPDEPELTEEELEQATASAPDTKAGRTKTSGKK